MKPKLDLATLRRISWRRRAQSPSLWSRTERRDNGLVGEIWILTLSLDQPCLGVFQLRFVGLNLALEL